MSKETFSFPVTTAQHDFAIANEYDPHGEYNERDDAARSRPNEGSQSPAAPQTNGPIFNESSARRLSFIDEDEADLQPVLEVAQPAKKAREGPVGWMELPQKRQLAILTVARLSEPLVQTSLQSYMFFQLKSFDESLPDSTIAAQAGMLQGSFTAAQFVTAMIWGRISDAEWGGRKKVLMIGLFGTMVSCVGFGFSSTFWQAMLFRTMGGALNGNVGTMRTMISEIIVEKRFQSRAFLILPMCFNVGVIIGPILGGLLADPAASYPHLFGDLKFFQTFPYALPNLVSAIFLLIGGLAVFLGLKEVLPMFIICCSGTDCPQTLGSISHKDDLGSKIGRKLAELWRRFRGPSTVEHRYIAVDGQEQSQGLLTGAQRSEDVELSTSPAQSKHKKKKSLPRFKQKLPFRRIFTFNVICTFIAHGVLACHIGTFNSLWFVFLSTEVADPAQPNPPSFKQKLPFIFTGGLGMPPRDVGLAMACLGVIGISLQLFVYPAVNARLGVVKSWRSFLYCFPVAYILVPFLAIVPSKTPPPAEKDGILVWLALCGVLFTQVIGRTFALPATIILLNNCSPHPSVLGTVHGIGQSISSAARTIGPIAGGYFYGLGLNRGIVGGVFWGLSCVAILGIIASLFVREGDGHEIILEGDHEAEQEFLADQAASK